MDNSARDELLIRIDERTSATHVTLKALDKRLEDHTDRISALEVYRGRLTGGMKVSGAVLGVLVSVALAVVFG